MKLNVSRGWNDEDDGKGIDVPEKHLKRETEDGTYEIRETGKEDEFNVLMRRYKKEIEDWNVSDNEVGYGVH